MSLPSLLCLSLVQVASDLFNSSASYLGLSEVRAIYAEHSCGIEFLETTIHQKELLRRLDNILLPETLKFRVWHVLRKLCLSVKYYYYRAWVRYEASADYEKFLVKDYRTYRKFSFTPTGELDVVKMIRSHVDGLGDDVESSDLQFCYKRACELCLGDCVVTLWNRMGKADRNWVHAENCYNPLFAFCAAFHGERCNLKRIFESFSRRHIFLYRHSTTFSNLLTSVLIISQAVTFQFFWSKLRHGEKNKRALECAKFACERKMPSVLYLTLAYLKEKQLKKLILEKPTFDILLQWPYEEHFMATFERVHNCDIHVDVYMYLFGRIVEEIVNQFQEQNPYHHILYEFWKKIPIHIKREMIPFTKRPCKFSLCLHLLREVSCEEMLEFIARDLCIAEGGEVIGQMNLDQWLSRVQKPSSFPKLCMEF